MLSEPEPSRARPSRAFKTLGQWSARRNLKYIPCLSDIVVVFSGSAQSDERVWVGEEGDEGLGRVVVVVSEREGERPVAVNSRV